MKTTKQLRKQFTRQFYKGNGIYLFLAMLQTITVVIANLFIAWLMQQLVDTATGAASNFTLKQIGIISIPGIGLWILAAVLDYYSMPKFYAKAMSQYKNYVFTELSKKSISAFSGENTAIYKEKTYDVIIDKNSEDSSQMQAAIQIIKIIKSKK